eukprot:COSAG01_NODE_10_length_42970_cov_93.010007_22_plen_178_part_00
MGHAPFRYAHSCDPMARQACQTPPPTLRDTRFEPPPPPPLFLRPSSTGAGDDNGIDHNHKNWLRFPYDSTFWRSHYLHPHPYYSRRCWIRSRWQALAALGGGRLPQGCATGALGAGLLLEVGRERVTDEPHSTLRCAHSCARTWQQSSWLTGRTLSLHRVRIRVRVEIMRSIIIRPG